MNRRGRRTFRGVGLVLFLPLILAAASDAANDLFLTVDNPTPALDENFTVLVELSNAQPFRDWAQFLVFDNTMVELVSQQSGADLWVDMPPLNGFYDNPPDLLVFDWNNNGQYNGFDTFGPDARSLPTINASGEVRAFGSSTGGNNAGGTGVLGRFTFKAIATGVTTITTYDYNVVLYPFGNALIVDNDPNPDTVVLPNITVGQLDISIYPTPVVMEAVSARSVGVGAVVEWTTQSEIDNTGFDVLRRHGSGGKWRRATERPIEGRLTAVGPASYTYLDLAEPGRYEYLVETISTGGQRERHGDREDMTVTVRPGDLVGAIEELSGLLDACAEEILQNTRAGAVAALRRRQLAGRRGRHRAALQKRRPERSPRVKVLTSTAEMSGARHGRGGSIPPPALPPGQTAIRTRGDGVFFVPAGSLPVAPERATLITAGVQSLPLKCDNAGIWFFAPEYRDSYTDINTTFVAEGAPRGRRTDNGASRRERGLFRRDADYHVTATARAEEDGMYALGAKGCPDPWLYAYYLNNRSPEQTVKVHVPDYLGGATTLRLAVYGYTHDSNVDPDHELIVSVNDEAVVDLTWDGRGYRIFEVVLDEGVVREGENLVGLLAPENPEIPRGHGLVLDYVEVDYARHLSLPRGPLALEVDRPCVLEVPGLSESDLWVVEVDAQGRGSPVAVSFERALGLYAARFRARRGFAYYVATPEQTRSPDSVDVARVGRVPAGTAYLAIGPERFRGATGPLLELHRWEALSCAYVSLDEVIDSYGWGRYGAGAITNLIRTVAPRYVLLVGDNSYDYLNRTGLGVDPMVPSILVSTSALSKTNADALYGDLDGDGIPDIPVGRLPVRTSGELGKLVAKILSHGGSSSGASGILVADDADRAGDFPAAQRRVAESFPEIPWTELYLGVHGDNAFVRNRLTESVNMGTDLVVYQGHGSVSWLAKGLAILDTEEAARWRSSPVVYLATCWSAFIQSNTESAVSIAEVFLRSAEGPPAVIGSTTLSMARGQEELLNGFLAEALSGGRTIGDALVAAQRRAAARAANTSNEGLQGDLLDAVRCYVVLGDPAMKALDLPEER